MFNFDYAHCWIPCIFLSLQLMNNNVHDFYKKLIIKKLKKKCRYNG